jgi:hypothetical protein
MAVRRFFLRLHPSTGRTHKEKRMKTLRESLITVLVVLAWGVVAHVADADLRERQRNPAAAQGTT